ncbi:MAG: hypothetical protein HQ518_29220 [Rhodopirellula sp.]|nr:hypothetical protein [Rhodopirellula sp.]
MIDDGITEEGYQMLNDTNAEISAEEARLREKMEGVDFEWLSELINERSDELVDKIVSSNGASLTFRNRAENCYAGT